MSTRSPASPGFDDLLPKEAQQSAALRLLKEALQLLDNSGGPTELGAQLDSVIHRLEAAVHRSVQRR